MLDYGHNWTQDETLHFVEHCYDRDTLLITLLNYAEAWLAGRMICVVAHEHLQPFKTQGWSGWGTDEEISASMVKQRVTLDDSPLLEAIIEQGSYTVSSTSELGFDTIFSAASVLPPDDLIIVPLQLARRTKMLLIGESKQATLDLMEFSKNLRPLVDVSDAVAVQLERIIKLSKTKQLPPVEERIPDLPERISTAFSTPSAASIVEEEATPPQLQVSTTQQNMGIEVPRKTQPIRIQQHTSELSALFDNSLNAGREHIEEHSKESSTHMGTPLQMIKEGMSIDIMGINTPPVLDKSTLEKLPDSPYEEAREDIAVATPQLEKRHTETKELEGVSIIEPIGLHDQRRAKRTLMGGFSIEDIKRAQARFEEEESQPIINRNKKASKTIPGISIPKAQVLKRRKRSDDMEPEDETTSTHVANESDDYSNNPTLKVQAVSAQQAAQDRFTRDQQRTTVKRRAQNEVIITPVVEPLQSVDPEQLSSSHSTKKMQAVIPPPIPGSQSQADDTREMQRADFPMEVSQSSKNWAILFTKLESKDKQIAYSVVKEFEPDPIVLIRLEEIFPGRLYVDRYQWTVDTLPPIDKHGPVLAALNHLGEQASPVLVEMMRAESIELRFYATYILSLHPVYEARDAFLERIFDRDLQTRQLAGQGLVKLSQMHAKLAPELVPYLAKVVAEHNDDFQVEIAAHILGELRSPLALTPLMNVLDLNKGRVKQTIHTALTKIALQPLPAATVAWRTWYQNSHKEERRQWILNAMVSNSELVRKTVAHELSLLPNLSTSYSPNAPMHVRSRAQQEVDHWFQHRT